MFLLSRHKAALWVSKLNLNYDLQPFILKKKTDTNHIGHSHYTPGQEFKGSYKIPKRPKVSYESAMQGPDGVFFLSCGLFNDAISKYHTYKLQANSRGNGNNLEGSISTIIRLTPIISVGLDPVQVKVPTRHLPVSVNSFTSTSTCSLNPVSNDVTDCYWETNERWHSTVEVVMRW
jgi:hypothetical protein